MTSAGASIFEGANMLAMGFESQNRNCLSDSEKVTHDFWRSEIRSTICRFLKLSSLNESYNGAQENEFCEERQCAIEKFIENAESEVDETAELIGNMCVNNDDYLHSVPSQSIYEDQVQRDKEKALNRLRDFMGYQKPRSESIGSFEAYRDLQIPSSVDLLRASIVKSIRKRVYDNQGFLERKFDGSDNKPAQYSGPKYTVVEVSPSQTIDDAESDLSDTERKDATNEENTQLIQRTNSSERNVPNSNTSDEPEKSLSINSDKSSFQNSNEEKLTDDWLVITDKKEVTDDQKGTEMNNFILARRKFNNSIFQDCSTYDITCPTAHLNEVNDKCSQLSNSQNNSSYVHSYSTTDSISLCSSEDYLPICSDKNNIHTGSANLNEHVEDHTALCDTFFTHVVSEEKSEVNPLFSSEQPITNCKSSLTERDLNIVEQSESEIEVAKHDEPSAMPAKRKFSRRHRKRSRKRTKSKKSYVYECTKCGVSYCIPTKAMNNVACCLHCDLWTPVEPVFVRREKTTWNTCRVS